MKRYDDWAFYRTKAGHIAYNKFCLRCAYSCKQSWRAEIVDCPRFQDWRNPNFLESKKSAK